jgi:hypothetical protein
VSDCCLLPNNNFSAIISNCFLTGDIINSIHNNCVSGVMVSVPALSAIDCEFESQLGQTKNLSKWYLLIHYEEYFSAIIMARTSPLCIDKHA